MATLVKLIVGALLDWLVKQTPTIIAYLERRAAAKQAQAQHEKNQSDIDAAFAAPAGDLPVDPASPAPGGPSPAPAAPPPVPGCESRGP